MKIDDLYEQILQEGISKKVYHLTGGKRLYNILKTDVFMLRSTMYNQRERDLSAGRFFFMSTARSKTSSFMRERLPPDEFTGGWNFKAVIHLNGERLGMNYGAIQTDFMRTEFQKHYNKTASELEDRIFSNKNHIPNAKKYITMVEIMNPDTKSGNDLAEIKEVVRMLDVAGIPWLIYEDERDLITNNTRKGLGRKELDSIATRNRSFYDPPYDENAYDAVLKGDAAATEAIDNIITLYKVKVLKQDLSPSINKNKFITQYKKWLENIDDYGVALVPQRIERDVTIAPKLKFMIGVMQKNGFSSLEKYVTHLVKMEI